VNADVVKGDKMEKRRRYKPGSTRQPFPVIRPQINVVPSRAKPFVVDCKESWRLLIVPELNQEALVATYQPSVNRPDVWRLSSASHLRVERPAAIHGIEGVEILYDDWRKDIGWVHNVETRSYYRLTKDSVQGLAELSTACSCYGPKHQVLHTFLDPVDDDWRDPVELGTLKNWAASRKLEDVGHFVLKADGSYYQRESGKYAKSSALGSGIWRVKIGTRSFTCLRVMEVLEWGALDIAYITRQGIPVLHRRYRESDDLSASAVKNMQESDGFVINDELFIAAYERIPAFVLGVK
jgi:hypothetical protein